MKRVLLTAAVVIVGACFWMLPTSASAFSFTANNFSGYLAYDAGGDVIGTYGLDPRFSYENTGMYFNTAAALYFDFTYVPTYPSIEDIMENPSQDWLWTISVSNLTLPWEEEPLPDIVFSHKASFNDIQEGAELAYELFEDNFPLDIYYNFDYTFTGPGTGSAALTMATNINPDMLPGCVPDQFISPFESDASITVTAEPVPEPISLVLFGAGMAGVGLLRRRKKA